jgi:hypothetical protein
LHEKQNRKQQTIESSAPSKKDHEKRFLRYKKANQPHNRHTLASKIQPKTRTKDRQRPTARLGGTRPENLNGKIRSLQHTATANPKTTTSQKEKKEATPSLG